MRLSEMVSQGLELVGRPDGASAKDATDEDACGDFAGMLQLGPVPFTDDDDSAEIDTPRATKIRLVDPHAAAAGTEQSRAAQ